MKLLSLIFCLYVTLLLAYPCQDGGISDCADNHTAQDCGRHHGPENNECHHCTPFCTCNCCQVTALPSLHIFARNVDDIPVPMEIIYTETLRKGVSNSVWQPPKA